MVTKKLKAYATQGELAALAASVWEFLTNQTDQITILGEKILSTQADVDALTAQVSALDAQVVAQDASVQAAVTAIQTEIAALQAQQVDTSGLEAAVAQLSGDDAGLGTDVTAVSNIAPPPAGS